MTPLEQFSENISRARALTGLAKSLSALTTEIVDTTDIHRAALVLAVSALDHFVHEFVRCGMLEAHKGLRVPTDGHLSFRIPLAAVKVGLANSGQDDWLAEAVREAHSWLSFQQPDKIAEAVRLVSGVKLWTEVGKRIGTDANTVKVRLKIIVDRRNKIAHEADSDPTNIGQRWPIDHALVEEALEYIETLAQAISEVAA